jgi:putative sigma-54 modulation protein
MRIDFQGLNSVVLEPRFIDHARPRLESLAHFSERVHNVRVTVQVVRSQFTVEITCDINGFVLRSETTRNDLLEAFDEAFERAEQQLIRWKKKIQRLRRQGPHRGEEVVANVVAEPEVEEELEEEAPEEFSIVRVKAHSLKPMNPQEAVLQMEMVGHDFYVFYDDTAERVGVVYRRKSGDYGLIEPEVGEE